MAALSGITAVRPTISTTLSANQIYGETIAAGQSIYQDSTTAKWLLADSNASSTTAAAKGIAVTPGVLDGYGLVATGGNIILVGTTATVGMVYLVGATPGSIVPHGDLTTGDYVTILGVASSTTQLNLSLSASGIVKP
jgi:hypothetical protein